MNSMKLTTLAVGQSADQSRSLSERAQNCCQLAKQLEKAGEYEAAHEALSEFWPESDGVPRLEGLDRATEAQVLLRVGALAGWLGSVRQTEGSQETAKNLITRSIEIFEKVGQPQQATEARCDLALCYWREGALDEARIILRDVLRQVPDSDIEMKAVALIRGAIVERTAMRYNEALNMLNEASPLVEVAGDDALAGTFHNQLATMLENLSRVEQGETYRDRALIEYAAASYHFEQAGHQRYRARVENNLGYLFFTIDRFQEAYLHLDRARRLFLDLDDTGSVAQVDETRSRALLAEGRLNEAERFAQAAVKKLEYGGEQSLLAEALTTHGTVLARMGKTARANASLQRAIEVAQTSGNPEGAGRAHLSTIEEFGQQTSVDDLVLNYKAALDLLQSSQDPATTRRLISCAQTVIGALKVTDNDITADASEGGNSWDGFSFKQQVLDYEKAIISRALRDTGGAVTKAARLLGFNHHQSLIALINSRHKGLLGVRSAVRKRRRSIIKVGKNRSKRRALAAVES
jgi:tetratricopeptide (TPR) repeat protein